MYNSMSHFSPTLGGFPMSARLLTRVIALALFLAVCAASGCYYPGWHHHHW
jgi:hypothetical protein